jgi:uncharacterized protein YeaO (DUF488 family)
MIKLKRVYEAPDESDGARVLVERLWPRGISKERAKLDLWLKEISPSPELRKWFSHDPEKWDEFKVRYRAELEANTAAVEKLRQLSGRGTLTLVYAASDEQRNSARILKDFLEQLP